MKNGAITMAFIFCLSCANRSENRSGNSSKDSVTTRDSTASPFVKKADSIHGEMVTLLKDYIRHYNDTIFLDTTFAVNGQSVEIYFKHLCLHDSALIIPSRYVSIYGLDSFVTHNFQSRLKITQDGNIVFDTVITKGYFKSEIFQEEVKYGALLYPDLNFQPDGLQVDYSVSIPLTDVGIGVYVKFNYDGKITIGKL